MENFKEESHESFGIISISKYQGTSEFFNSDIVHNGGVFITISTANKEHGLSHDWVHEDKQLIKVRLSHSQFVDAITSGMNTEGVPCTLERFNGNVLEQISHAGKKEEEFKNDMRETQQDFAKRIDEIIELLMEGNVGKKKQKELEHELKVLRSHILSNTEYVMKCFNESVERTVSEAKSTVSNYIDSKVTKLGIEKMKEEFSQLSLSSKNT